MILHLLHPSPIDRKIKVLDEVGLVGARFFSLILVALSNSAMAPATRGVAIDAPLKDFHFREARLLVWRPLGADKSGLE